MDFKVGDTVIVYTAQVQTTFVISKIVVDQLYGWDEDSKNEFWVWEGHCRRLTKLEKALK